MNVVVQVGGKSFISNRADVHDILKQLKDTYSLRLIIDNIELTETELETNITKKELYTEINDFLLSLTISLPLELIIEICQYLDLSSIHAMTVQYPHIKMVCQGREQMLLKRIKLANTARGPAIIDSNFNVYIDTHFSGYKAIDVCGDLINLYLASEDGYIYELDSNDNITRVMPKIEPVLITGGDNFIIVLDKYGNLHARGQNSRGQLGLGFSSQNENNLRKLSNITDVSYAASNGMHTLLISKGQVYSFGITTTEGVLGLGNRLVVPIPTLITGLNDIVQIATGKQHSLALDKYGNVYSFGSNSYGQLGISGLKDAQIPTFVHSLADIVAIAAGDFHSLVLTKYGTVYGFGLIGGKTAKEPTNLRLSKVIRIWALGKATYYLTSDIELYVYGVSQKIDIKL